MNPEIVNWAVKRSGLSEDYLPNKYPKYSQWLDGTWNPTVKQLKEVANSLHVRLCELFSESIPDYGLQIADFRTVDDKEAKQPSPELYDTIDMMIARQSWMRDYFGFEGYSPVAFIGSYSGRAMNHETAVLLASEMHALLGLNGTWASQCDTVESAFKTLKNHIEMMSVSVVVNGVVGDNTSRSLDVDEFRGFVLADTTAPVIFINGRDTKSAQIFTLIHELCHLAYAQTGVSNAPDDEYPSADIELFCNTVAAEFLVPGALLKSEWISDSQDDFQKIKKTAAARKVNFIVVARKARDMGLVSQEDFFRLYNQYKSDMPLTKKRSGKGGNYLFSKQYRLGNVFSDAVRTAVGTNYLDYRDAYDLTGMKAPTFKKYFEEVV